MELRVQEPCAYIVIITGAGGLELLLSTDIRAAAPTARFGLPEVRWSIYPLGDRVRASRHFNEGVAAFLEKRKPNYT